MYKIRDPNINKASSSSMHVQKYQVCASTNLANLACLHLIQGFEMNKPSPSSRPYLIPDLGMNKPSPSSRPYFISGLDINKPSPSGSPYFITGHRYEQT